MISQTCPTPQEASEFRSRYKTRWRRYTRVAYAQTQYKIIVSDNILGKVINVLGLATEPESR